MTRDKLIEEIRTLRPDYTLEGLEVSETRWLEHLLDLLKMYSEVEKRAASEGSLTNSPRRGDEPPVLTDEDEEILDHVWAQIAEREQNGNIS
jgi:hypothetical protein